MDSRAKQLVETGNALFDQQKIWNNLRQEIAEIFYPMRSDFTRTLPLGTDFQTGTMDSFPIQSRETLGNMPHAMVRQGDWFAPSTGEDELDEDHEVMEWTEKAKKVMRKAMYAPPANFAGATIESDHDFVTFGNGVLTCEETTSRNGLIYKPHHPRDVVWMTNGDGVKDHVQRAIDMSARNVVKRWPGCHADIKKKAEEKPNDTVKIRHILMPVDEMYGDDRKSMRQFKKMPFVSLYVDIEHQEILGQAGMPVFNYIIPGWRKLSNLMYAFSPATLNCLPDGRMIQDLARILLEQGEKAIDPPIVGKGDMFRDAINLYAGGFTYVDLEEDQDLRQSLMVLENKGQLGFGLDMKQDVRSLIAESMLLSKLFLPSTKDMTAFETNARLDEVRRAALPFFGPYESECNLPLCDVTFQMLINARVIPTPPDKLRERDMTFKFEGPLNSLEGRQTIQAYTESLGIIQASAAADPSIAADYDLRKATRDAVRGTGAKPDWFKDEEEADPEKQATQEALGVSQTASLIQGGADAANSVADATLKLQQAGAI